MFLGFIIGFTKLVKPNKIEVDPDFADAERGDCLTVDKGGRMEDQNGLSNLDDGYVASSRVTIIIRGNAK